MVAELYFPAEHWATPLEPSQLEPVGHGEHDWRVVVPPPVVKKCVAQSTQAFWPALEYLLSLPQSRHLVAPLVATKVPGAQGVRMEEPEHVLPGVHLLHSDRVVLVFPEVDEPAGQLTQALAVSIE